MYIDNITSISGPFDFLQSVKIINCFFQKKKPFAFYEGLTGITGQTGDIVIPVYLGGTMLDEVIINAQQRANLRSGGR